MDKNLEIGTRIRSLRQSVKKSQADFATPMLHLSKYSVKADLGADENKSGLRPIRLVIRVKQAGQSKTMRIVHSLGERIKESDWSGTEVRKSHSAGYCTKCYEGLKARFNEIN